MISKFGFGSIEFVGLVRTWQFRFLSLVGGQEFSRQKMGWATSHIAKLKDGETVRFRPRGNSMVGKIESGQLCTVVPIEKPEHLKTGDIVLCKVNGSQYLHLIKTIQGLRFQIGNNRGRINGWITANSIFGKCASVEP